jgi:protein scribble
MWQEVNLIAKPGQGFGLSIRGGVNGYAGNPADPSDEGIFISQIIPGGAAGQEQHLHIGQRILQVYWHFICLFGRQTDG